MLVGSASADQPVLQPGATSTAGVVPVVITGNPQTCEELGCTGTAVKIDKSGETQTPDLYDGVYSLGSQTITIDATTYNLIAWSATTRINCIYMKGANGGDLYSYCFDPPISSDSGLTTPVNAAGTPADISHIIICYTP
ncbi:MAG TPA: hypothetical protein VMV55_07170, partial [Methanoregula sp.]|nr:hypothetical protein [Methanoregula sp.]